MSLIRGAGYKRDEEPEAGALAHHAHDFNPAFMPVHYLFDHGQTETGAAGFGGEERREDLFQGLLGDARTGVLYVDADHLPRHFGAYEHFAGPGHDLDTVLDKVPQGLRHLVGVDSDRRVLRSQLPDRLDMRREREGHQQVFDIGVQMRELGVEFARAGEAQDLVYNAVGLAYFGFYDGDVLGYLWFHRDGGRRGRGIRLALDIVDGIIDDRQRIPYLVAYDGSHLPDGGQPLLFDKFVLRGSQFPGAGFDPVLQAAVQALLLLFGGHKLHRFDLQGFAHLHESLGQLAYLVVGHTQVRQVVEVPLAELDGRFTQ